MLFYQFYAEITKFFYQEMFGLAPLLWVDVGMFRGNWCENDVKKSKSSVLRHAQETSYTPSCKSTFPSPGWVHGNPGRICKNLLQEHQVDTVCHAICIVWMHYWMMKSHCSNFWIMTFFFQVFTVDSDISWIRWNFWHEFLFSWKKSLKGDRD